MANPEQWYHVVPSGEGSCWGFAIKEGRVTKSAFYWMLGKSANDHELRNYFLESTLNVYKI